MLLHEMKKKTSNRHQAIPSLCMIHTFLTTDDFLQKIGIKIVLCIMLYDIFTIHITINTGRGYY